MKCDDRSLFSKLKQRVIDVVISVYLFHEKRGFRHLDQLAEIFATKFPNEKEMLSSIQKHAADERKHYLLFCGYFRNRGTMPYAVDESSGYCDQIVKLNFGVFLDQLSLVAVISNDKDFFRLFRLILFLEFVTLEISQVILLPGIHLCGSPAWDHYEEGAA